MKKKLVLLSALCLPLALTGCRITVNGSSSPFTTGLFGLIALGLGIWYYSDPESAFHFRSFAMR